MYTFILMTYEFFKTGRLHWYMLFILFILYSFLFVVFFAQIKIVRFLSEIVYLRYVNDSRINTYLEWYH